ncbi:hypothetical protein SADUNF_Sadunf06G0156500 [Salix dunnii]|uniref:Uncharacterized protein n=1 Tax=Salix dunnii TaxID=1413687 RepID=A0A835K9K3_9ROSI|nr:hypothetical protein SADUNF_Sadunf06G0156500 [Salix dunnii]
MVELAGDLVRVVEECVRINWEEGIAQVMHVGEEISICFGSFGYYERGENTFDVVVLVTSSEWNTMFIIFSSFKFDLGAKVHAIMAGFLTHDKGGSWLVRRAVDGLYCVGDSCFPGKDVLAVAFSGEMCAHRVAAGIGIEKRSPVLDAALLRLLGWLRTLAGEQGKKKNRTCNMTFLPEEHRLAAVTCNR